MPDILIRAATTRDESDIARLLTANALPLDGVHDALEGFVIAEHSGAVIGTAAIEVCGATGINAMIRSVATDANWRGQGIGKMLVARAIESARQMDVIDLYLLTTTAEPWFHSFGFITTTRDTVPADVAATVEFTTACPASATVMVLPLVGA